MKIITILYLIAQSFDFLTTYIGLSLGLTEVNPYYNTFGLTAVIILKIVTIIMSAYLLEKFRTRKFYYIVPGLCWLIVFWNTFNIVLVLMYR